MKLTLVKVEKEDWIKSGLSESAHKLAFSEIRNKERERIDYAILVIDKKNDAPRGYMTCMELDSKTVYWQYGGTFPGGEKSIWTLEGYSMMAQWHRKRYHQIVTFIENTNTAMLKMALKVGFLVTGIRYMDGKVLLEATMGGEV